jgi:DNA-binding NarL/FixJ family response regulator
MRGAARPGATARSAAQPIRAFDETNPIFAADHDPADRSFAALDSAIGSVIGSLATKSVAARNAAQPGATPRNAAQPNREMRQTNPNPAGELSDPRRLAAARLIAQGRSVPDAARELKLNRGTVWRWQREPAFRAELRRIHERMVAASSGRRGA